ncbi:MAG: mannose-1-phosphate guanylyltransferase [Euryarchaeota archaeon]|nr:mannose-1-phosphate guanylyltransferase [Euryarchaeota archaeon]|tara:strand:- start:5719 stop:6807 length:1089 start_codon:yes stop_codon:yes gene_type:complete
MSSDHKMKCVIMAGGRGTRFWPVSRKSNPKQMLNLIGEKSLLQMTVDRLSGIEFVSDIYVVTNSELAERIKNEVSGLLDEKNIILEPSGKNTAPAIGLVAFHLSKENENSVMGVFPADHLISNHETFSESLQLAAETAISENGLVTLGINPAYPSTGYGYIQVDKNDTGLPDGVFNVDSFIEKPDSNLAIKYLDSGNYLWNSGMFVWKVSSFLKALKLHMPNQFEHLEKIGKSVGTDDYNNVLSNSWENIEPESVDYGMLEKSDNVLVVEGSFDWNDIGSWNSIYEISEKDSEGNAFKGDVIILEGINNLIHSPDKLTAVIGVDNIVVVNLKDVTLIVPKESSEDVRKLVDKLVSHGREDLL